MELPGKGRGVVSTQDIPKNTFICEYVGELITWKQAVIREEEHEKAGNTERCYMYYFPHKGVKLW